jgi:hypothetical protein
MRSILATPAAQILRVSRILHGNGTLTHYRGLRDDGMRGHRGRTALTTLRPPTEGSGYTRRAARHEVMEAPFQPSVAPRHEPASGQPWYLRC